MSKRKLVLVGNGMAGVRCLEEILKEDPDRFEITVFGKEPYPNYNRIMLSSVLQGDTSIEDIVINSYDWYEKHNIQLFTGESVEQIDTLAKTVHTDQGRDVAYDDLILATGSNPFMLPLPGSDKEGVIAFRDIKDCQAMIDASQKYKKAVVIGGGLLGLEAARGLLNLGMDVDVVHIMDHLMERQLDASASSMLKKELESQGMNFLMNHHTEAILGSDRVKKVSFKDGRTVKADLVVMAVGIKPNIAMAQASGIQTNRGVVVDDYMQTSAPNVYAVGECAEHREMVYGLVAPLYEQGKALAKKICQKDAGQGYQGSILSTKLKVSGVDVFSAGEFGDDPAARAIRIQDEFEGIYKKVIIRQDKIVGAVLFGDTSESTKLLGMINQETDTSDMKNISIFQTKEASGGESTVAQMADTDTICGCNGVSKGDIVTAIKNDNLTTVAQIKDCTSASRSCGTCKGLVGELLAHTLGEEFETADEKETVCSCTDLTHEEVVANIREKGLTHTREVMNVLGWKTEEGCSKCRPAVNYYLGMVHPTDYEDERESRFVNERMHANIQKNGTYSVVPRMYGGVTNAKDLRKIADVADKYDVPLLKITGGQRIDMLGIKKEDVPNVWKDLDMPSGYAYGKAVRTVKTCVGENFCRFGTQDSIGLGIAIEKKFERLNTPHKVKMGVSACPRNCAESSIKDVGIIGVEGAWEIYVGGNGGATLKAAELLCTVSTDTEVLYTISAYLQYYRETAHYLERTSHWLDRVGLEHVKSVILDNKEERRELIKRMEIALDDLKDPWHEIIQNSKEQRDLFENKAVPISSK
ncbi:NAD(P)/FAD-dependent oxidoreductase [Salipaludibacillus agaradhaerens]|uniref:nitrite reductase large subunit NirB n=1 Tax=Salipaludibacillus agaradhaerens TaxID=76935 RepID=UPI002150B45D|nr:nitrite reductase large subunit NirB [Salipaludibacillus agaradhaerens]MCR6105194.1 NAD(P)/FAD-dependent oxidoreductase [Salipaludibacillus agaradhaerens]MCR6117239.1 NAD(P)/FAD-dependent oxidoreductase [Salipaludibacillus agaradhaerens]UJW56433.1 NAD(P)/FAD-dependent oxidoreductase [Bacillus sp. A116_S68]